MKQTKLPYNRADMYARDPYDALFSEIQKICLYFTDSAIWLKLPNCVYYKINRPDGPSVCYSNDVSKWHRELRENAQKHNVGNYYFSRQVPLEKLIFCAFFLVFWDNSKTAASPRVELKTGSLGNFITVENFKIRTLLADETKFNIEDYRILTGGLSYAIMGIESANEKIAHENMIHNFTYDELIEDGKRLVYGVDGEVLGRWNKKHLEQLLKFTEFNADGYELILKEPHHPLIISIKNTNIALMLAPIITENTPEDPDYEDDDD